MKLKNNFALKLLAGVVFVMAALSVIVSIIGYYLFTRSIVHQYSNSAWNTARTAAIYVVPGLVVNPRYDVREWQARSNMVHREWQRLANTQNASLIYVFRAYGENYQDIEFFTNVAGPNFPSEVFPDGYKIRQKDQRYLHAFKKIYEEGQERVEIEIYRAPSPEFPSGNHITVMIPFKDNMTGEILAIIAVEREMEELDNVRHGYLRHVLATTAILLVFVIFLYGLYLKRNLIAPIRKIAGEALRFAYENKKPDIPLQSEIKTQDEVGQLALTIDTMESDILNYVENLTRVTKEKEQIKAELNVATQIQADMLPRKFPPFPERNEFEIYASMNPAKEVGGDFYDFFFIDHDHLALVIADVSGKGVPAALFMVISKTLIKNRAQMGGTPAEILHDVNNQLCEGNEADLFVTVWLGILEISTGHLISANAGHEYPALKRAGGKFEIIKAKHSPAVATMEGIKFKNAELDLGPGDLLYVYTDGVAEATNSQEELYGTDRMIEDLNKNLDADPEELLIRMKQEVDNFTGDAPQFDDITMLGIKISLHNS